MQIQFNLPKSWHQVTVAQYQDIISTNIDDKSIYEKYIEWLSIISDTMPEEWEDMDIDEVGDIIQNIDWIRREPTHKYKEELDGKTLKVFNNLTLGEFIDLEYFTKEDWIGNLPLIMAILYRQTKTDEWGNTMVEPYDNIDIHARAVYYLDIPITDIYGVLVSFNKFKREIYEGYSYLFMPNLADAELDDVEELTPEEKKDQAKEEQMARYSWENLIYTLANEDITKQDTILRMSLIGVFNHLSYKKVFEK